MGLLLRPSTDCTYSRIGGAGMNFQLLTDQYYSLCLGEAELLCNQKPGIRFICSNERNTVQPGYAARFDVYAFCQKSRIIVSYGDKAADRIDILKETAILDFETFKNQLRSLYGRPVEHHIKYCFTEEKGHALSRALTKADFQKYLTFFKNANPDCQNTNWVKAYFYEMITDHLCCGVFENNLLASCTDAPKMPYRTSEVQEIGINTLPEYRKKGYAADACALCTQNMIARGKCPLWSTSVNNIASQKLAEKIGFKKLADVLALTL